MSVTRSVVILGNSGLARECHMNLRAMMEHDATLSFKGFLSFEGYQADLGELAHLFLGNDDDYTFSENEAVIIGIGDPRLRHKVLDKLKQRGATLFTLRHPEAYIDRTAKMGEGNIFTRHCNISCDCVIGDGNLFNGRILVGHDVHIGHCNFMAPSVHILGNVNIENVNSIGTLSVIMPNAHIGSGNIIAPLSAIYKGCGNRLYFSGNPARNMGSVD